MDYPTTNIRFKYYGKHIELLVEVALQEEDKTKQESLTIHILRLMKSLYQEWNRDAIDQETLLSHLNTLSQGKLTLDPEKIQTYALLDNSKKRNNHRRSNNTQGHQTNQRSNNTQGHQTNQRSNNTQGHQTNQRSNSTNKRYKYKSQRNK